MTMMGKTLLTLLLLSSVFSIASSRRSRHSNSNIDWWCNQTPHPEPCKYYMMKQSHYYHHKLKHKTEFRKILIHLALERVVIMRSQARELGRNRITKKQRSVFRDCLKLYDNTIFHLNRTLEGLHVKKSCSTFDAQTWLSTARTNMDTCQHGALELGVNVGDFMVPSERFNVTEIISNSLFVNWAFLKQEKVLYTADADDGDAFPRWFSLHERRLLLSSNIRAHLIVAKDGSGHFRSVQDAINAAARRRFKTRFVIHVKRGVYRENIEVGKTNDNVMLVGDGMRNTIITSGRSVQDGYTTYSSATAGIDGVHFIARDITFRNTAGPRRGQAVALRSASDLSVFYRCSIEGYQDTLMVHAQRQFYRGCYIYGTVDFIFGNAAVVFQNCVILVRRPLNGQANMITAQGRDDPFQNTGFTIHNSQIRAAPDLRPVVGSFNTFLGRPWQRYSRVVVMKTFLDGMVSPMGWSPWGNTDFALNTLYYGEYRNFGPGSSTRNRVRWAGFHSIRSPNEASQFTVANLLAGRTWLPATGVPFTSGL